ncbi:MAG: MMPL family transporter [Bacteroidales bacterium]|nr:MMPL family transporter [Bacteroidales bacterium]
MHRIFLPIYRYFQQHKGWLYAILAVSTLVFILFGARLRYEEDIIKLLPRSSLDSELAFGDIGLKDKIFIQITGTDPENPLDTWTLGDYIDEYTNALRGRDTSGRYIVGILSALEVEAALGAMDYGFEHLPSFIDTAVYGAMAAALEPAAIEAQMARNLELIEADMTGETTQLVCTDPLALRDIFLADILPSLEGGGAGSYTIENGHFFCPDKTVALAFVTPAFTQTDSGNATRFARILTQEKKAFEAAHPDARILIHGAPLGGVSNAGTIKKDLVRTVGISLIIILAILLVCFRKPAFLGHLITPIIYGAVFSLACLYWIKGTMSLMALGIGAIVLGVALSYVLHVLIHFYYVEDVERVLQEESTPVFLGCLTTIGAFLGLLFTESDLLRDFGLFATFALIGSTFYALVFLPHFLRKKHVKTDKAHGFPLIDRVNNFAWDRNPVVLGLMALIIVVGVALSGRVKFDSDLRNLDYDNAELRESQTLYNEKNQNGHTDLYFAVYDDDLDQALEYNKLMMQRLEALSEKGLVKSYGTLVPLLFQSTRDQELRIAAWKAFWTPEKIARTRQLLSAAARKHNLDPKLFTPFFALLEADYEPGSLLEAGVIPPELLSNYVEEQPSGRKMIFTSVSFAPEDMDPVIEGLIDGPQSLVLEPFYYCRDLVRIVHDDFNTTLWISSLFVLLVLLIAFRNIWVAVTAFLPMFLSWYVLQGLMALLGLEFNLINIVISTFIFGIGVDYSIFIMEGLLQQARTGEKDRLASHKVAIFFSALVLIIVVASLIFARHPSIRSIGLITLIGMLSTILMTYSLEPLMFRLLLKWKHFRRTLHLEEK